MSQSGTMVVWFDSARGRSLNGPSGCTRWPPPTEDDVTVLLDGRRLDSRESVEAWLKEVDAIRVRDAVTHDIAV